MEDPVVICIVPRSCFLSRGKGLINLLACKVKGDDPKIKKKDSAKSY